MENDDCARGIFVSDPIIIKEIMDRIGAITPVYMSHSEFEKAIAEKYKCTIVRKDVEDSNCFQFIYNGFDVSVCYGTRDGSECVRVSICKDRRYCDCVREAILIENEIKLFFGITAHDLEAKNTAYIYYCMALATYIIESYQ